MELELCPWNWSSRQKKSQNIPGTSRQTNDISNNLKTSFLYLLPQQGGSLHTPPAPRDYQQKTPLCRAGSPPRPVGCCSRCSPSNLNQTCTELRPLGGGEGVTQVRIIVKFFFKFNALSDYSPFQFNHRFTIDVKLLNFAVNLQKVFTRVGNFQSYISILIIRSSVSVKTCIYIYIYLKQE